MAQFLPGRADLFYGRRRWQRRALLQPGAQQDELPLGPRRGVGACRRRFPGHQGLPGDAEGPVRLQGRRGGGELRQHRLQLDVRAVFHRLHGGAQQVKQSPQGRISRQPRQEGMHGRQLVREVLQGLHLREQQARFPEERQGRRVIDAGEQGLLFPQPLVEGAGGVQGLIRGGRFDHRDDVVQVVGEMPLVLQVQPSPGQLGREHLLGAGVHPQVVRRVIQGCGRQRDCRQQDPEAGPPDQLGPLRQGRLDHAGASAATGEAGPCPSG